tara:strand:+ start:6127 stop:6510 length:384 start_codon:yes stop_codon:yes gene_type:complete
MSTSLKKTLKLSETFTENAQKAIASDPSAIEKIKEQAASFQDHMQAALRTLTMATMSGMMNGGKEEDLLNNPEFQDAALKVTDMLAMMVSIGLGKEAGQALIPAEMKDADVAEVLKARAPNLAKLVA